MTSLTTPPGRSKGKTRIQALTPAQLEAHNLTQATPGNYTGPCPVCAGDDRFTVDLKKGLLNCRNCKPSRKNPDALEQILTALETPPNVKPIRADVTIGPVEYAYRDANGKVLHRVYREDTATGKKHWQDANPPNPMQPYQLPELLKLRNAKSKRKTVYVVEGEKCADALQRAYPRRTVTTWAGGASNWPRTDWRPLTEMHVVLWADNDDAGVDAMVALGNYLAADLSCKVALVTAQPGEYRPTGWDVADLLATDGAEAVRAYIKANAQPLANYGILEMSECRPKNVTWLWPAYLPQGQLTIINGDPGEGKSTLTLDLAARVSRDGIMPDGAQGVEGVVLLAAAEDDKDMTMRPRLDLAGANVSRIKKLDPVTGPDGRPRALTLDDTARFEHHIKKEQAKLLIIDPLFAYWPTGTNTNTDAEVRVHLAALSEIAMRYSCTVLAVRHFTKQTTGKALYRGMGSIAFVASARAEFVVGRPPRNPDAIVESENQTRLFGCTKQSLAVLPPTLEFESVEDSYLYDGETITNTRIVWGGKAAVSGEEIANPGTRRIPTLKDLLLAELAEGEQPYEQLVAKAKLHDMACSPASFKRAKKQLGITDRKRKGDGRSMWQLPPKKVG